MISSDCTHGSVLLAGRGFHTYSGRAIESGTDRIGVEIPGWMVVRNMHSSLRSQRFGQVVGTAFRKASATRLVRFDESPATISTEKARSPRKPTVQACAWSTPLASTKSAVPVLA